MAKKDVVVDEEFEVLAFAERVGDDGEYLIINCKYDGKNVSFATGAKAVVGKLKRAANKIGRANGSEADVYTFTEPLITTLVNKTSKVNNKTYYDLE